MNATPLHAALAAMIVFYSATAGAEGDPVRGRALAEPCAACHGETGNASIELTPSLAAQPAQYLFLQLFLFREGLRQVPAMTPFVEGRSDQELEDLAAHFAGLPLDPPADAGDAAMQTRGAELSQTLRCGSCHLPGYTGQAQMPRLAGQREDYLRHAMQQYQVNDRAGTDTSMTAVLHGLSSEDIAALAHYMARRR